MAGVRSGGVCVGLCGMSRRARRYSHRRRVGGCWSGGKRSAGAGFGIEQPERAIVANARTGFAAPLPVREVVVATGYLTDLSLGLGEVVYDYLHNT